MPDYKNGKIYTIRYRGDDSFVYVGSTTQPLYKRWFKHKSDCFSENRKNFNLKLYQKIRETNDFENWYIELYEEYACDNKELLLKREGEVIRKIGNLNIRIEGRTQPEYYIDNKTKIDKYKKEWYKDNREHCISYTKEYTNENKEKVSDYQQEYRNTHKEEAKEYNKNYRIVNQEKKKEIDKQFYEKNRDRYLEKVVCDCGCEIIFMSLSRHKKTKKHLKAMQAI